MPKFLTLLALLGNAVVFSATVPTFQAETTEGKSFSLKDKLKEGRPVLISFWATWCQPCVDELNHLKTRLKKETAGVDVVAINVDTSETSSDVRPTMRLHKIEFPVILDPTHQIFSKFNSTKAVPFSVLVSPQGEILQTYSGYSDEMMKKLESYNQKAKGG